MATSTFNYTNRKTIKNSAFQINIEERAEDYVRVKLNLDLKSIKPPENSKIVLDAYDRSIHERYNVNDQATQIQDFIEFNSEAKLKFRLRIVSTTGENQGKVFAASKEIKPKENSTRTEKDEFFKPIAEDLGDLPWDIDWDGDETEPKVRINIKLQDHFGGWRNSTLQALLLPQMLKELLLGIIVRSSSKDDIDDDTFAGKLIYFCHSRVGVAMPEQDFLDDGKVNTDWLTWVDNVITSFCEFRWRDEKSLLEQMLEIEK